MPYYKCEKCGAEFAGWGVGKTCQKCGGNLKEVSEEGFYEEKKEIKKKKLNDTIKAAAKDYMESRFGKSGGKK